MLLKMLKNFHGLIGDIKFHLNQTDLSIHKLHKSKQT